MVDFSFIVSLYVSDLPNVTIVFLRYTSTVLYCNSVTVPSRRTRSDPNVRSEIPKPPVLYVLYIRPLGAVYGWIRLARTRPSRRRGRVRAGRIRPYTATRGLI